MKYFAVSIVSASLRIVGVIMLVGGIVGFFIAMGSVNWSYYLQTPQAAYNDPAVAWYVLKMIGAASSAITGFTLLLCGQFLRLFIDIALNTAQLKELVSHSRETTAFFTRVGTKTPSAPSAR